ILLLRHSIDRLLALYSMWEETWGVSYFKSSLERYLLLELLLLKNPKMQKIVYGASINSNETILNYRKLCYAMKINLDVVANASRPRRSVDFGFIADSLILPQLKGWIENVHNLTIKGNLLIMQ